jgi:hypothetical protein
MKMNCGPLKGWLATMWTGGIIRKSSDIQQARISLAAFDKQALYGIIDKAKETNVINVDQIAEVANVNEMAAEVCWLSNREFEVDEYVHGLGLDWLPEEAKKDPKFSVDIEAFVAVCRLVDEKRLTLTFLERVKCKTKMFAGVSALESMSEIIKVVDGPTVMFLIGSP